MNPEIGHSKETHGQDRRLLYYCPASLGGIADYAHEQAKALAATGLKVTMLCPVDYPHSPDGYDQEKALESQTSNSSNRWISRFTLVRRILKDARTLDRMMVSKGYTRVLFANYSEYLAPLWAWRFQRRARQGVVFSAVVHDPVRDYVVGPLWWHRRSIAAGYSFLRDAFVHAPTELDTGQPMPTLKVTVIPHGPFSFPQPSLSREQFRAKYEIPESAAVFLSFGHIRDGKNLNLILDALKEVQDVWLLIAGSEATPGQRQSADYIQQAAKLDVAKRCRWMVRFLSPDDVSNCFNGCDVVALTYSSSFRSASGVLNVAAWFRKPVIASCGQSNLGSMVENYGLGERMLPDDPESIAQAMQAYMQKGFHPRWDDYVKEHSWERNAQLVIDTFNHE
ncbi:MAG: glycosyltransferase family 4 protein [Verrucomicrobiae bacterium]|nr:glycosyltransferase family 4 protein [Verrucomicrobiae bacterium]NNJ44013.1 glycosyltransferase family 4 protein [Akkermansiaceae bacterium]